MYLTVLVQLLFLNSIVPQNVPHSPDISLPEDGKLNFTGLARKYAYGGNCEEHNVVTEDGYILMLFHVPGNKSRPVFLQHGIMDTADSYVLRGNTSLTSALSEAGYDVWIGNSRGNRYSRRHIKLNPDTDKAFWNYSFHEMGYYDLPAMIDYILNKTGASQLSAIGHSQGNQIFYMLGATRPEYNVKIRVLVALAPICFLHNVMPPVDGIVALGPLINEVLTMFGQEELLGDSSLSRPLIDLMCLRQSAGYRMCVEGVVFSIAGPDHNELEPDFSRIAIAHYPTGTSRVNLVHLMQVAQKKDFMHYDYGLAKNLAVYNSVSPPKYDLSKVTMKVVLIAGRNDRLSSIKDVKILKKKLPNAEYQILDYQLFNHLDYIWGRNMRHHLFPSIFKVLDKYNDM